MSHVCQGKKDQYTSNSINIGSGIPSKFKNWGNISMRRLLKPIIEDIMDNEHDHELIELELNWPVSLLHHDVNARHIAAS